MTRTHLCSTPPDAYSRQQINSTIPASSHSHRPYTASAPSQFTSPRSPLFCSRIVRQSAWRRRTTHRCLRLCVALEPDREMSRWMCEWPSNCNSETGKKRSEKTSDGPMISGDSIHPTHSSPHLIHPPRYAHANHSTRLSSEPNITPMSSLRAEQRTAVTRMDGRLYEVQGLLSRGPTSRA